MAKKVYKWYSLSFGNKKLPAVIGILVLVLWCATLFGINSDNNKRGTFGDMFGAVNALFSGLAFAGIIYSLAMQRTELRLQRKELKMQREENHQQTIAFIQQNNLLNLQRFEVTFFNMLSNLDRSRRENYERISEAYAAYHTEINIIEDYERIIAEIPALISHIELVNLVAKFIIKSNIEDYQYYIDLVFNSMFTNEKTVLLTYIDFVTGEARNKVSAIRTIRDKI